jgi:hypothetical protein
LALLDRRPTNTLFRLTEIDNRDNLLLPLFGIDARPITTGRLHRKYEVERIIPGTISEYAGIGPGDLIRINRWDVDNRNKFIQVQLVLESQRAGYMQSVLGLGAFGDSNLLF